MENQIEELKKKNEILRKALIGLVGSDDKDELEQMEASIRMFPAPDEDYAVTINAIHAILKTA